MRIFPVVILILAAALGLEVVMRFWLSLQADMTMKGVQSLLTRESVILNPSLMANSLQDLEDLGVLNCVKIVQIGPPDRVFIDDAFKPVCTRNHWLSSDIVVQGQVIGGNGRSWRIDFLALSPAVFVYSLWLIRGLLIIIVMLFYRLHRVALNRALDVERLKNQHSLQLAELAKQVAHDIRSPLSALKMATQFSGHFTDERRSLVQNAVNRIQQIASDLLDRGHTKPRAQAVSLATLIKDLLAEKYAEYSAQPGIQFILDENTDALVEMDPTDLRRVISNLVNNAVEATPGVGQVHVTWEATPCSVVISIQDHGIGMSPEILSQIGQPGFTHRKTRTSGSGLGLAHAKKVIQANNGRLEIDSQLGVGTQVRIHLPPIKA